VTHHKLPKVEKRLARIESHVKGIRKMVDEEKSYSEMAQQITAVRAARDGALGVIVDDLLDYISKTSNVKGKKTSK
jgi:DNA-binding FrmR family transcriptional regulator